ncbi:DUF490 domain-containing protein [Altererythrobacter confluentis]|uniref:DUF490 domain-containing protein n=1 Tax=Allopontixanthobacter confluentis TaxID=1849021 RepID=A0A6L7GCW2_9SPHN|nr:translocation/assembly module TamB domain-containing protein [Allopontixanthobacter confluentis]MXP13450.1 DUF490 domain-containing protein [Allopontixanthobacter confluentis]
MADEPRIEDAHAVPETHAVDRRSSKSLTRRAGKWLLRGFAVVAALIMVAVAVFNGPIGQRFVTDQIAKVAPASGLRIQIGRIDGNLYGKAVLHDVVLSDPKGKFLTIPTVDLDWRPLSWFTSGLDIRKLVANRGTLLRVPELLPGDPEAPILPDFDIRIDRFQIVDLTIAPGIAGDKAQKVNLVARSDIKAGKVYVKLNGTLGKEDRLYALIHAEPDNDKFDVDVDYQAPKGGVLAGILGTDSAYRGIVTGAGSWTKWRGALLVKRDDARVAAFRILNQSGKYTLIGQADPTGILTGLPADALGKKVLLVAKGTLVDSVLDGSVNLQGRAFRALANGSVDLAGNAFGGLKVDAILTDPALFGQNLRLEDTRIAATLNGPFRNLSIVHDLEIGTLVSGKITATNIVQKGTARFDGTRWTVPLSGQVARIATGNGLIDPQLVNGRIGGEVMLSGNRLLSDNLDIRFPGASAQLALQGDLARSAYVLAGPVKLSKLALKNVGTVNADANILFKIARGAPWTLSADITGAIPAVTNATLANLAGPAIAFRGGIALGANGPIAFRRLVVGAAKLQMNLDGRITNGTTTVAGSGRHTQYGPFTVEASVGTAGPNAVLVFASPLPAAGLENVRVAISPTRQGFAIETEGGSLLGPFAGQLDLFSPAGGPTRIAINTLDIWKTSVSGDLVLGTAGAAGTLALAGGGLDGTITLVPRGGGQAFDVDVRARNATFGGATPISIARADIEGSGLFVSGKTVLDTRSTIAASAFAEGVSYGRLFIGKLAAKVDLVNGEGPVTASLSGRRGSRFNLQLTGNLAAKRVSLAARGDFAGRKISMPRRAILTKQSNGGWILQPTQLSYGGGRAIAEGSFGGGGPTALDVKLADLPLSLIDIAIADMGFGGTVSGLVDYRAAPGGVPSGTARVQVKDLSRSGLVLSSRNIDLALVMKLTATQLQTRAAITEGGQRRGRLQASITNLPPSGNLMARMQRGRLFAQLRFKGPADALWRLAAIEAFDLTGPLSVAADFTGSLADPLVRGSLASDNLRMQSALSGTDVRNITARGKFFGSRLQLTGFSGTTPNGGTVSGSGTVDLKDLGTRGPDLDIRLAAKNARMLNAAGLDATVTGPLRIVSNGVGGTIAGRLDVNRASWKLGTMDGADALPQIRTVRINVPADIGPSAAPRQPWRYLIDARARNRVNVDGMGLDSEWAADVIIRGTTADPRIGGEARMVRGDYSFAGTRFELTRGRIAFDANLPIDPRLDIVAEAQSNGIDVAVKVQGNALQPEISFSSTPLLPEEEILARLLFGGSITELSATDALQLGAALASLRGGAGVDPINRLRTAIGLDRLRIVSADPALRRGTGVALGKNIGRRFYVEIITDGRGYSATQAEFRITSWLSLLGSISTAGRESLVAEVSKDY